MIDDDAAQAERTGFFLRDEFRSNLFPFLRLHGHCNQHHERHEQ
jgi:hypothetical protein